MEVRSPSPTRQLSIDECVFLCFELIILVKMMREGGDPLSCVESLY